MPPETPKFTYTLIVKSGRSKEPVGILTTDEVLTFNTVLKIKSKAGTVLHRVQGITFNEDKNGISRVAEVTPLLEEGANIVEGSLSPIPVPAAA